MNLLSTLAVSLFVFDTTTSFKWAPNYKPLVNHHKICHHNSPLDIFMVQQNQDLSLSLPDHNPLYGVSTHDTLFKWMMGDPDIRLSFFNTFIPGINVTSSEVIGGTSYDMNHFQYWQRTLYDHDTQRLKQWLQRAQNFSVIIKTKDYPEFRHAQNATALFKKWVFQDLLDTQRIFQEWYNNSLHFMVTLDTGEKVLIETHPIYHHSWQKRALSHLTNFYITQANKNTTFKKINRIIGLNIAGPEPKKPIYTNSLSDNIIFSHYSIATIRQNPITLAQREWLLFLRYSEKMTAERVTMMKTPAVRRAFQRITLSDLPVLQQQYYAMENSLYQGMIKMLEKETQKNYEDAYEQGFKSGREKGRNDAQQFLAFSMLCDPKYTDEDILILSGITPEVLLQLKRLNAPLKYPEAYQ